MCMHKGRRNAGLKVRYAHAISAYRCRDSYRKMKNCCRGGFINVPFIRDVFYIELHLISLHIYIKAIEKHPCLSISRFRYVLDKK